MFEFERRGINMKLDKKSMQLYVVTDRGFLKGETLYEQVEKALKGGATFVQLREKDRDAESILAEARQLKVLCAKYHVPFIINDSVKIAMEADADGVHLGQEDMGVLEARKILGEDKIIGVTAKTIEQAVRAQEQGADYLGVGAVFASPTKTNAIRISKEQLREICEQVSIPVVAIGGITADNMMELKGSGIDGVAVVSAIFASDDIEKAARDLKEKVELWLQE